MSRQLVPWRRSPLFDLHRELEDVFGGLWEGPGLISAEDRAAFRDFRPHMDVAENEEAYTVTVELPGLDQKDVDVSLTDNVLVVQGEKRLEAKEEGESQHRSERMFGRFQRAVRLAAPVSSEKIEASFKNGVLTVRLPKAAEARPRKVPITVQS